MADSALAPIVELHPEEPAQKYVPRIRAEWRKCVDGIVEVGRLLLEFRDQHPDSYKRALDGAASQDYSLPFTRRTAQMLIRIAEHGVLADPANHGSLPPSWRTLAELARLDADQMRRHIASNVIHSAVTRAGARGIVREAERRRKLRNGELRSGAFDGRGLRVGEPGFAKAPEWTPAPRPVPPAARMIEQLDEVLQQVCEEFSNEDLEAVAIVERGMDAVTTELREYVAAREGST